MQTVSELIRQLGRAQRLLGGAREALIEGDARDLVAFAILRDRVARYEGEVFEIEDQLESLGLLAATDRTPSI